MAKGAERGEHVGAGGGVVDGEVRGVDVVAGEALVKSATARNDYGWLIVVELVGRDVQNKGAAFKPGVRSAAKAALHVLKAGFSVFREVLREQQAGPTAATVREGPEEGWKHVRLALFDGGSEGEAKRAKYVYLALDMNRREVFVHRPSFSFDLDRLLHGSTSDEGRTMASGARLTGWKDWAAMREPATGRDWCAVLLRTFLPAVWRMPELVRRGMANRVAEADVRTLERRCYAQWFDRKESRLFRRELRRRSARALARLALQRLGVQRANPTPRHDGVSGRQAA